jgi:hypothetical protein
VFNGFIEKTIWVLPAMLAAAIAAGCVATDDSSQSLYQRLQAEDPAVRIQAAREAAGRNDRKAVGLLIDRLDDPEADVRLFSHIALQKITDQDFGWQPWKPDAERQDAARKWRAWWLQQQGAPAEAATPEGAAAAWMTRDVPATQPADQTPETQPATQPAMTDAETGEAAAE